MFSVQVATSANTLTSLRSGPSSMDNCRVSLSGNFEPWVKRIPRVLSLTTRVVRDEVDGRVVLVVSMQMAIASATRLVVLLSVKLMFPGGSVTLLSLVCLELIG